MGDWTCTNPLRADQLDLADPVDWSHPQARGLVAYYPLWLGRSLYDMGRDRARRVWPLDPYSSPQVVADPVFGRAFYSDNPTDSGTPEILYNSTPILTAAPLSIVGWAKADDLTNGHCIASICNPSANDAFYLILSGHASGDYANAGAAENGVGFGVASSSVAYKTTEWQHYAGVFASSTSRTVYINGGSSGSNTDNRTPGTLTRTNIGRLVVPSTTRLFKGRIAEVRFYNRALSAREVYNLWHPGRRWGMLRTLTGRRVFTVAAGPTLYPFFFNHYILRRRYA